MIRRSLLVLGSCCLLGACGSQFSGDGGGSGGTSGSIGRSGASAGGSSARAGSAAGGRAGAEPVPDAGADSGGEAGSTVERGGAGSGGGSVIAHGGASGNAGSGGSVGQPVIPQQGLALWLRADQGVQQVGGRVQTWLDQSGNQRNAVAPGANVRPQYSAKGLNGLPTLQFDGEGQFLQLPNPDFGDFSRGLAGFMVLQPLAATCASVLELSNGSEVDDIAFGLYQDEWTYEPGEPFIQTGKVDLLAPSLYGVNHSPDVLDPGNGPAELRIGGATLQSMIMPVPPAVPRQNNFVGHTLYQSCNYFEGMVSEIIVYQRSVTPNEVKAIEGYLSQHWGLGQ